MQNIGERIKNIRLSRELSIRKAATSVQMSHSYWNSVENGDKSPSLTSLKRIAEALDVRLIDIIEPDEKTKFSWFYELPSQIQTWIKNPKARESLEIGEFIHRHNLVDPFLKAILMSLCINRYLDKQPEGTRLNYEPITSFYGEMEKLFAQVQKEDYLIKTEGGEYNID